MVPETGNPSEIKGIEKLTGYDTFYKVRIGDYRVGLEIDRRKRSIVFAGYYIGKKSTDIIRNKCPATTAIA